ncbi:amino acid ABC transporter permease [Planosporangium thailandense]|uniref:Amino acid ABC transporter permease n=1 Tax=Planosporangium thailandense TaxID=765197 RepID=A0ABX0XVN3_9ACTN|nr:amino acid ABC transporter permease [Planosporangium thailandense]NJC69881.1 amino acid ABC transporter permease [Planosporangium thailandense]
MSGEVWSGVANGILTTVQLTVFGFALGAVLGVPVMLLRVSTWRPARWTGRAFIELVRGVPLIVWLFLIYNGPTQFDPSLGTVFTSWRSGVAALGLVSAVYMAEIYRGSLRAINAGQWEASQALGMSRFDTASRIIAPQVTRVAVPASTTYALSLIKDSSLVSAIGVFETTYYATTISSTLSSATPFVVAGVYYIALTIPAAWAARRLDSNLRRKVMR